MLFLTETPTFLYFFSFFISTVIFSYLFLTHLGLYGVFLVNGISLGVFWVSLLFYIGDIFFNQSIYNVHFFQ